MARLIERISTAPIAPPPGATVIDGQGRTLMPGLIDNHWHTMFAAPSMGQMLEGDLGYLTLLAAAEARATLMRGFTTVRDLGGPSFALKRAIDEGRVVGPRIYPSGAMITITGGHGDFRAPHELPRQIGAPPPIGGALNASQLADSPDEVRLRTREQLLLGASQIKLTAGGGVASPHSPLDASTFTEEELRAAVQAAGNWGTYVGVHAYTPQAIQRAIGAGVKVIEHGHLMDDDERPAHRREGRLAELPALRRRRLRAADAAVEHGAAAPDLRRHRSERWRWPRSTSSSWPGAPTSCSPPPMPRARARCWCRWASGSRRPRCWPWPPAPMRNCCSCPGPRNPYPGKLGVVEEGALADLLLVDGNPLDEPEADRDAGQAASCSS